MKINRILAEHVLGIKANPEIARDRFEKSEMIITAFLPIIGYDKAEDLVAEFKTSGEVNFKTFLKTKIDSDLVDKTLSPDSLMMLGYRN